MVMLSDGNNGLEFTTRKQEAELTIMQTYYNGIDKPTNPPSTMLGS